MHMKKLTRKIYKITEYNYNNTNKSNKIKANKLIKKIIVKINNK